MDERLLKRLIRHPAARAALVDRVLEAIDRVPLQPYPKEWVSMPRHEFDALMERRRRLLAEEGL